MPQPVNNNRFRSFRLLKPRLFWKSSLLGLMLILLSRYAYSQTRVNFSINPQNSRKPISPLIYGTNDQYPYATAKRLGGNRITNYNWENNASNAGFDWFHESDNYVPGQQNVPENQYDVPGAALSTFHQRSLNQNAYSLVTLPMAKYVTKDKNGAVTPEQAAPSSRWAAVKYRKPSPFTLLPDVNDGDVYVDEELNYLQHHFGRSNTPRGVRGYALDNEPGLWASSHSRMWGTTPVSVRYLMDNSFELAQRIKEMDPTAEVFGPASFGISEFENLQFAPDWDQEKGNYPIFLDLYLGKMREKEQQGGKRLLDVLDVHWYPERRNDGLRPTDNRTDYANNAARMAMTRSLWDPTYNEGTFVSDDPVKRQLFLPFLPKMHQHIAQYYPGTKLAITEYSYMGLTHASGGIAQADALGIFGKQGVYLATYWGGVVDFIKSGFDLYRNYDGQGGHFGDTSVESSTGDLVNTSVFAAINGSDDSKLHVVALSKNQDGPITATFTIGGSRSYKSATVWAFDNSSPVLKQLKSVRTINDNTFEYVLPALTACHFVLSEENIAIYPDITETTINPSAGYSDGTATFELTAKVADGDNDLAGVTADLSPLGGGTAVAFTPSATAAGLYRLSVQVPAGTAAGSKSIKITAKDAANHTAEAAVSYRVIKRTAETVIWDGDEIKRGTGGSYYDPSDTQARNAKIERRETGGQHQPGSLFMHFEHANNRYNTMTWRLTDNDNPADARDIRDFGALEFSLKSNAPENSDIEVSLRDATAQLHTSNTVWLKQGGYLGSLNSSGYTRVKIPLSAFTTDSQIDLGQIWQLNFNCNTAQKPFDVWIDDVRVLPYSNPVLQPVIRETGITPTAGYADGKTTVTIFAQVDDPDNNLRTVTVDLAPLGLTNKQAMTLENGRYAATVTVPSGVVKGAKQLNIAAVDAEGNSADASVQFTVNEPASSVVLWDGDVVNTGKPTTLNAVTTCVVDEANGNKAPKSMKMHFDMADNGFAAMVWDWNENTNDEAIKDLSTKGYVTFYVKVSNPGENFDFQVFLKDRSAASTSPVPVRGGGYVTGFTGDYQRVRVPMSALLAGDKIDTKQVTRIGFLSTGLDKAYDFWVDDIEAGGSNVADVKLTTQNAACGSTGAIRVVSINGSEAVSGYTFYLNNVVNPAGAHVAVFSNLAPGKYDLRIEGNDGFLYYENVPVGGGTNPLSAAIVQNQTTLDLTVSGGSGSYSYRWSNGGTTEDLTNATPGTYRVTVTDQVSGCTIEASITATGGTASADFVVTDATCKPNGRIEVQNVTGSGGNTKYAINGKPNPAGADQPVFSDLAVGDYEIVVTGDGDFRLAKTVSVQDKGEKPVVQAEVSIENEKAYINLNVTGGSGIYIYKWSEGSESQNLWEVLDGTYQVEVSDAATGCSTTASYTIVIPGIELTPENPSCAPNGKIRVTAVKGSGGNNKYYINGEPNPAGINNPEFGGLVPGTFRIKVEGEGGFQIEKEVTLEGSGSAPEVTANVSYLNGKGYINLNVTGGSGIYTYEWSNGATTLNIWEVPAGTYSVVVTDLVSQCKTTYSATLSDASESIMIYPNPVVGQEQVLVRYNFVDTQVRKVVLKDHVGVVVYTADVAEHATEITVPVRNLRSGTYLVVLEGKTLITKHLIVQ
ncbi:glycoside hydrolase family 44 protein [Larkinella sp. C7]|uniref:glycoside hydrolase family 44 protein n=1 Tax=Larkinella sp. C7 TaxID=2576607 RepID=UPI0011113AB3|nr:glycoside hydrolase family 44 protein [Larkinella sp. C7]